jgi:hypothetical protein
MYGATNRACCLVRLVQIRNTCQEIPTQTAPIIFEDRLFSSFLEYAWGDLGQRYEVTAASSLEGS